MLIYVEIFRLASYNRALIGKQTSLYFGVIFILEFEAFMLECGLMTALHKTIIVPHFFIVINTCFLERSNSISILHVHMLHCLELKTNH
jgi:hypothetical protein